MYLTIAALLIASIIALAPTVAGYPCLLQGERSGLGFKAEITVDGRSAPKVEKSE